MTELAAPLGILHDLDALVDTHLFVLSPNNCGSTFVKNALALSRHTWNLRHEGQHAYGFVGPAHRALIWASDPHWAQTYATPGNFDWDVTRRAWYAQSFASNAHASVFVEKSPPFVLLADQLRTNFKQARFVLLTRDPYAMYEGIIRRRLAHPPKDPTDPRVLAARHVVACLRLQADNRAALAGVSTYFSYEQLCADPASCDSAVRTLVPSLDDVEFNVQVSVKGMYDEQLRNMNADSIARLSREDRAVANSVFGEHTDALAAFGYEVS